MYWVFSSIGYGKLDKDQETEYLLMLLRLIKLSTLALLLSSCSAIPIEDKAKSVRIIPYPENIKGCEYIKEAFGLQGNIISYWFTSNTKLVNGALNDLKNKAAEAGGNVIVFEEDREVDFTTSTVFIGYIYRCK